MSSLVVLTAVLPLGLVALAWIAWKWESADCSARYPWWGRAGEVRRGDPNPKYSRVGVGAFHQKETCVIISKGSIDARQAVTTDNCHPSPCLGKRGFRLRLMKHLPCVKDKTATGQNHRWLLVLV